MRKQQLRIGDTYATAYKQAGFGREEVHSGEGANPVIVLAIGRFTMAKTGCGDPVVLPFDRAEEKVAVAKRVRHVVAEDGSTSRAQTWNLRHESKAKFVDVWVPDVITASQILMTWDEFAFKAEARGLAEFERAAQHERYKAEQTERHSTVLRALADLGLPHPNEGTDEEGQVSLLGGGNGRNVVSVDSYRLHVSGTALLTWLRTTGHEKAAEALVAMAEAVDPSTCKV